MKKRGGTPPRRSENDKRKTPPTSEGKKKFQRYSSGGSAISSSESGGAKFRRYSPSSSDSPVTPIDPIKNLHILVNNPRESRRISVTDALKISTSNIAWIGHEERERGNLVKGKFADMVVIDRNPYVCPERIGETKVLMTISEGRVVYQSAPL